MESKRLHPLLIVATLSLTAFSAVGVGVLTGLIPQSRGSSEVLELPKEVVKPVEPAITHPVAKPAAPKLVARPKAPRPAQPVEFREFDVPPPVLAQARPPAVPAGITGTVEGVREVTVRGEAKGGGAVTGGIVGGLLGSQLGRGDSRKILTLLGVAGGALAGNHIEKTATATKLWEISVRLDDGSTRTLSSDVLPYWHAGDRVRFLDGKLQPV